MKLDGIQSLSKDSTLCQRLWIKKLKTGLKLAYRSVPVQRHLILVTQRSRFWLAPSHACASTTSFSKAHRSRCSTASRLYHILLPYYPQYSHLSFPFFSVLTTRRPESVPPHFFNSSCLGSHHKAGNSDNLPIWRLPIQLQDHKVCPPLFDLAFGVPTAVFAVLLNGSNFKALADLYYRQAFP